MINERIHLRAQVQPLHRPSLGLQRCALVYGRPPPGACSVIDKEVTAHGRETRQAVMELPSMQHRASGIRPDNDSFVIAQVDGSLLQPRLSPTNG